MFPSTVQVVVITIKENYIGMKAPTRTHHAVMATIIALLSSFNQYHGACIKTREAHNSKEAFQSPLRFHLKFWPADWTCRKAKLSSRIDPLFSPNSISWSVPKIYFSTDYSHATPFKMYWVDFRTLKSPLY